MHKQMNFGDPIDQAIEQLIRAAIYTSHLYFFDNVCRFGFLSIVFAWNPIDIGFREVQAELIETRNKQKTSDPSNCKNPVITLETMGHDPSD